VQEFRKTYRFSSEYTRVRATLAELLGVLRDAGIGSEDAGIVEVVLAEALNNVVEHAYREAPDGHVELTCDVASDKLRFELRDHGVAMPDLTLPEGTCPSAETALEDLPEGGFGWHLIHTLTEDLSYRRDGDLNRTDFAIPLTAET